MGAGASAAMPEKLDKETARGLAGEAFDEARFDAAATDGLVSRDDFLKARSRETRSKQATAAHEAWAASAKAAWAVDLSIDPMSPLMVHNFHYMGRMACLLLPQGDADVPDIRLLDARKLIEYIDSGGKMVIRQTLEAERPDIFLTDTVVRSFLGELEVGNEPNSNQKEMLAKLSASSEQFKSAGIKSIPLNCCTFPPVTGLSYAWVRPDNPDPTGEQLKSLRPVLAWYMCERARRKLGGPGLSTLADGSPNNSWEAQSMQTMEYGVFIDFMSMYQPDDYTDVGPNKPPLYTVPTQQASFNRALNNIGLIVRIARGSTLDSTRWTPLTTPTIRAAACTVRAQEHDRLQDDSHTGWRRRREAHLRKARVSTPESRGSIKVPGSTLPALTRALPARLCLQWCFCFLSCTPVPAFPLPYAGSWTYLERRMADLEAPFSNAIDVAAWPQAELKRTQMKSEKESSERVYKGKGKEGADDEGYILEEAWEKYKLTSGNNVSGPCDVFLNGIGVPNPKPGQREAPRLPKTEAEGGLAEGAAQARSIPTHFLGLVRAVAHPRTPSGAFSCRIPHNTCLLVRGRRATTRGSAAQREPWALWASS